MIVNVVLPDQMGQVIVRSETKGACEIVAFVSFLSHADILWADYYAKAFEIWKTLLLLVILLDSQADGIRA